MINDDTTNDGADNDGADNDDYILMKEEKEETRRHECRDQTQEELRQE